MIDNKPFAAIVTGAITFGVGYHALDLVCAVPATIAVMALYWISFDHEPHTPEPWAHKPISKFSLDNTQRPPSFRARLISESTIEPARSSTPFNPGAAPLGERVNAGDRARQAAAGDRVLKSGLI
jgi:hypothetical protein